MMEVHIVNNFLKDMDQDQQIEYLERRIKRLENKLNGGSAVSKMIESLVGQDVTLNIGYEEIKCRILECDDEWIKLFIPQKKKDVTVMRRIAEISKITLDKDGI